MHIKKEKEKKKKGRGSEKCNEWLCFMRREKALSISLADFYGAYAMCNSSSNGKKEPINNKEKKKKRKKAHIVEI